MRIKIPTYLTIDKQPGRTIVYNRAGSSFSSSFETCLPTYLAGIVLVSRAAITEKMSLFFWLLFFGVRTGS